MAPCANGRLSLIDNVPGKIRLGKRDRVSKTGKARASEEPEARHLAVRELPLLRLVPTQRPPNADLFERGMCVHREAQAIEFFLSGRDGCNLFTKIRQKHIDRLQGKTLKPEKREDRMSTESDCHFGS